MRILHFGSQGMLGKYMGRILSTEYEVINSTRDDFNIETDSLNKLEDIVERVSPDVVVNCAGKIPQREKLDNLRSYIAVNTVFPLNLQGLSSKYNFKLIHITTDCVYNGDKGGYTENDKPDETNIYGVSKSTGEPDNSCVIRTSIIGESSTCKKGLMEWVKSKKGCSINGYTEHIWNGITCLTLSKIVKQIIDRGDYWTGVRHIFSPDYMNKYELCLTINNIYNLGIDITPLSTEKRDMRLSTCYSEIVNQFSIKGIEQQLIDQKEFVL